MLLIVGVIVDEGRRSMFLKEGKNKRRQEAINCKKWLESARLGIIGLKENGKGGKKVQY